MGHFVLRGRGRGAGAEGRLPHVSASFQKYVGVPGGAFTPVWWHKNLKPSADWLHAYTRHNHVCLVWYQLASVLHAPLSWFTPRPGLHWKGRDLRRPQMRVDRRLEEVAKSVGGGYCRLKMTWKLALAARET